MDVVLVLKRAGRHGQKQGLRQAHLQGMPLGDASPACSVVSPFDD